MADLKHSIDKIVHKALRGKKLKKKTRQNKSSKNVMDNLAPIFGLFVFVGLVAYRNYLISVDSSEAVMLHHFKRQLPTEPSEGENPSLPVSGIPAKLRRVHAFQETDAASFVNSAEKAVKQDKTSSRTTTSTGSSTKTLSTKGNGVSRLEIYTPSDKEKELASMQMKRRYDDRKKLLLEKCGGELERQWNHSMQLIAVPDKKISVCVVQKAGSTSWHKLVYRLRLPGLSWQKAGHQLNRLAAIDLPQKTKKILMRSGKVTRVITVRHPFSRLVSGWHNKFHQDFKMKAPFLKMVGSYLGRHTPEKDHIIAFQDFAQFIADNGLEDVDVHFKSIEQLCSPCHFPYDYVVRAETALDDLWYVLDKINTTMDSFNKHIASGSGGEKEENSKQGTLWMGEAETIRELFKTVPRQTIEKLMSHYVEDFDKFGYTFDLDTLLVGDIID